MLTSLHIKNFAIVSELELDFSAGMTAFTGETGAGKSIMIDALMLALGGRTDVNIIRSPATTCEITATFSIDQNSPPAFWLKEQEIYNNEQEIILRRVIYIEGRSKSYINGNIFPLQKVKEISEMLVDIHGQHQHQTLLQHATHRQQLDQYARHHDLLENVKTLFAKYQKIKQKIEELEAKNNQQEKELLLKLQIEELENLALKENELALLNEEHQLLHNAQKYLQQTQDIQSFLNSDEEVNVQRLLNQILLRLNALPQENKIIKNTAELINNALIQCEEAIHEINFFSEKINLDPDRLNEVEARISQIHHVARKFHIDVNDICSNIETLKQELQSIKNFEYEYKNLLTELEIYQQKYEEAADKLSSSRKLHAQKLAKQITTSIKKLGMPQGYIEINITRLDKIQAHGFDKVEYMVCTNPGMTLDSLGKIVSGGELSRIGLAIHVITAERGATPTLLFDEVDVGIGGATAALVGKLLRNLGERLQVFCVTHQPQVAACAHHHFLVEKNNKDNQTFSNMVALKPEQKIEEIARMLGGLTITEQSRSNAKELMEQII